VAGPPCFGSTVRKLHVVGFTTDLDGLIFSTRKGSKSGSFVVPITDELKDKLAEAERLRNGEELPARPTPERGPRREGREEREAARPHSELTPREIQARLRAGRTIDEVAKEARCTREWVERFAAPILAEQAQVVELARGLTYSKARLGESGLPLGESVAMNLADKGVLLPADVFDDSWSAFQLHDGVWLVRFAYRSRGRLQQASWEVDLNAGRLLSRDRLASDLGYVEGGRIRRLAENGPERAEGEPTEAAAPRPRRGAARARRGGPKRAVAASRAAAKRRPASRAAVRSAGKRTEPTAKGATARKRAATVARPGAGSTAAAGAGKTAASKVAAGKVAAGKVAAGKAAATKVAATKVAAGTGQAPPASKAGGVPAKTAPLPPGTVQPAGAAGAARPASEVTQGGRVAARPPAAKKRTAPARPAARKPAASTRVTATAKKRPVAAPSEPAAGKTSRRVPAARKRGAAGPAPTEPAAATSESAEKGPEGRTARRAPARGTATAGARARTAAKTAAGEEPTEAAARRGSGGAVLPTQTRVPPPPPAPSPPTVPEAETEPAPRRGRGSRFLATRPAGPRFGTDGTRLPGPGSTPGSSRGGSSRGATALRRPPVTEARSAAPSAAPEPPPRRSGNGSQGATLPPLSERLRRQSPRPSEPESGPPTAAYDVLPNDDEPAPEPPRVRASIFGERPSPAGERQASRPPIALGSSDEDEDEGPDEGDGDDQRSRPGSDPDADAFVIRPRISAKQASELTLEERPSWRSRLRKSEAGPATSNFSVANP
jgi:hypothetical protein